MSDNSRDLARHLRRIARMAADAKVGLGEGHDDLDEVDDDLTYIIELAKDAQEIIERIQDATKRAKAGS